jgi:UrcA family protein
MIMNTTTSTARKSIDVRNLVLAAFATACVAGTSAGAHAAEQASEFVPVQKTVPYGDLNLASSQGVEQLYRRIVAASLQVCAALDGRSLQEKQQFSICTKQSIAHAVTAVDQPALAALHALKTGQPERLVKLAKQSR